MCGLIAYLGTKEEKAEIAKQEVINQYEEQFKRGVQGFGTISIEDNQVIVRRATEPVKAFFDIRDTNGTFIMFHHRNPTSTDNMLDQTHPIHVPATKKHNALYVMHNGVIRNDDALKEVHEEKGYVYQTEYIEVSQYSKIETSKFNDSESLAIELARFLRGEVPHIGTYGSAAFFAIEADKNNKPIAFHYGRNDGNPLRIKETENGILIASEANGELIDSFELNTRIINNGILGAHSKTTLPFAVEPTIVHAPYKPPTTQTHQHNRTVGFGAQQSLPGTTSSTETSIISKKEEKRIKQITPRTSLFDDEHSIKEMEKFSQSMEEICESGLDAAYEVMTDFTTMAVRGEAAPSDLKQTMKIVAAILAGIMESQDQEEQRILEDTEAAIMSSIEEDTETFKDEDLPFGNDRYTMKTAAEAELQDHIKTWGLHLVKECRQPQFHTKGEINAHEPEPTVVY